MDFLSRDDLARRIRLIRKAKDLTLHDVSQMGGMSVTHAGELERGKASPTMEMLNKVCLALNVAPDVLIKYGMTPEELLVEITKTPVVRTP